MGCACVRKSEPEQLGEDVIAKTGFPGFDEVREKIFVRFCNKMISL